MLPSSTSRTGDGPDCGAVPRDPARAGHRRLRRAAVLGAVAALTVVVAAVGDALWVVNRIPTVAVAARGSGEGTSYLLLASDSRERLTTADRARYRDGNQPSGERADLVLVLRVPVVGRPTIYSLPRDLYVGQQRDRPHRLGLSLQDGPQAIVDSLCSDVGVGVDHVLIADMDALVGLVDNTGPVSVRTAAPVRDRRAALSLEQPGLHRLDGRQALAWVRSRHPEVLVDGRWVPDATSDPTRTSHAVEVLTQVREHLDDPVSVQRGAWQVGPRLRRDRGLDAAELLRLGDALGAATRANRLVSVPARLSGTEVPFAFVTPETEQALQPLRSRSCPAPG